MPIFLPFIQYCIITLNYPNYYIYYCTVQLYVQGREIPEIEISSSPKDNNIDTDEIFDEALQEKVEQLMK